MFAMTNQLDMGGPWEEFLIARHGRDCPSLASNFSGLWFSLSLSVHGAGWSEGVILIAEKLNRNGVYCTKT